jgi:sugar phosphate permease
MAKFSIGQYPKLRRRALWAAFISYGIYYFGRVNISMALPLMQKQLGYSKVQLGLIVSALQITYGLGKFLNGVIADRSNPKIVMAIGLCLSGVANLIFGLSSALWVLVITWAFNGWFQSMGFPSGARSLSHWYKQEEYGRIWGIYGCSHQVGAGIIYFLGGYLVQAGWQYAFIVPSILAFIGAIFTVFTITDIPEKLNLPTVEEYFGETKSHKEIEKKPDKKDFIRHIFSNLNIWLLGFGNMFLYIVRYGLTVWTPLFISSNKGIPVSKSGWVLAIFELAGIAGMLLAGHVSDTFFKGRRAPIMSLYMFLLSIGVIGFWFIPYGNLTLLLLIFAACGFLVYGPLMLVSVAAATFAGKKFAASSSGFTGLWGYVGATLSGVGIGWAADEYGWEGAFAFIILSGFLSACCFAATWKADTRLIKSR